jgi:hypothetical protein
MQYTDILSHHPELENLLEYIRQDFFHPPLKSVILTGGLALGAFSTQMSDIDVIALVNEPLENYRQRYGANYARLRNLAWGDRLDVKFVSLSQLGSASMTGHDLEGASCELHEIDVIIARKHGILLTGDDLHDQLEAFNETEVIDGIIAHVIDRLLPKTDEAGSQNWAGNPWDNPIFQQTFLMSRCLYTLYTGQITNKPASADWLNDQLAALPFLQPLAELASRFAGWYRRGSPNEIAWGALYRDFLNAQIAFMSGAIYHRIKGLTCSED